MSAFRTHYDNLQVQEGASAEVIKGAYRFLQQKWHPDRNADNREKAERITKILNDAYRVLSDPALRAEHDAWIRDRRQSSKAPAAQPEEPSATASESPQHVAQDMVVWDVSWPTAVGWVWLLCAIASMVRTLSLPAYGVPDKYAQAIISVALLLGVGLVCTMAWNVVRRRPPFPVRRFPIMVIASGIVGLLVVAELGRITVTHESAQRPGSNHQIVDPFKPTPPPGFVLREEGWKPVQPGQTPNLATPPLAPSPPRNRDAEWNDAAAAFEADPLNAWLLVPPYLDQFNAEVQQVASDYPNASFGDILAESASRIATRLQADFDHRVSELQRRNPEFFADSGRIEALRDAVEDIHKETGGTLSNAELLKRAYDRAAIQTGWHTIIPDQTQLMYQTSPKPVCEYKSVMTDEEIARCRRL